jgi:hypothetical protein
MKHQLIIALFAAAIAFASCNTSADKVENAQKDVANANEKLDEAQEEYLNDMAQYKVETQRKIEANNQRIAEFNARVDSEKKEARADYKAKVAELEKRNTDMKMQLADYKADGKENWEKFKYEFNQSMENLEQGFRDLGHKDSKDSK